MRLVECPPLRAIGGGGNSDRHPHGLSRLRASAVCVWAAFVRYAEASFVRAPASGMLCCEGKLDGTPCPKAVVIDLKRISAAECEEMLPRLHMDHTHDIKHICEVWSKALPERPEAWDDGICGPLLAHLLFGTEDHVLTQCSARPVWRRQIVFRCGSARGVEGQRATDFCHERAHYGLRTEDVAA